MNTAAKGRRFEYKTRKSLEKCGYTVVRSAASKGAFDLVALSPGEVRLIQVKVNIGLCPAERESLDILARKFKKYTVETWFWKDRVKEPIIEIF